jgi:ABC-type amino acid transport substrate-binding protein
MRCRAKVISPLVGFCLLCSGCIQFHSGGGGPVGVTSPDGPLPSVSGQPMFLDVGIKTYQPGLDWWPLGQDDPDGFEWSMISSILGLLGYRIRPVQMTSDDWEQMLDSGIVSVAVGSISDTAQRQARYLMAGPYMDGELAALTLRASHISLQPDDPLRGQTVCYVKSIRPDEPTTAQMYIKLVSKTVPFQTVTSTTTPGCLLDLEDRTATVFVSDAVILRGIAVHSPSVYTSNDLGGQFGEQQDYMIAFARTAAMSQLCTRVDRALAAYLNQGWWTDFSNNLGGTIADQEQIEEEYQPAASDIDQQLCALNNG